MIAEFDRIVLTESIPEKGLEKGDVGTVVFVHQGATAFEVEFFTLDGQTRSVETLLAGQIREVRKNEVTSSREI